MLELEMDPDILSCMKESTDKVFIKLLAVGTKIKGAQNSTGVSTTSAARIQPTAAANDAAVHAAGAPSSLPQWPPELAPYMQPPEMDQGSNSAARGAIDIGGGHISPGESGSSTDDAAQYNLVEVKCFLPKEKDCAVTGDAPVDIGDSARIPNSPPEATWGQGAAGGLSLLGDSPTGDDTSASTLYDFLPHAAAGVAAAPAAASAGFTLPRSMNPALCNLPLPIDTAGHASAAGFSEEYVDAEDAGGFSEKDVDVLDNPNMREPLSQALAQCLDVQEQYNGQAVAYQPGPAASVMGGLPLQGRVSRNWAKRTAADCNGRPTNSSGPSSTASSGALSTEAASPAPTASELNSISAAALASNMNASPSMNAWLSTTSPHSPLSMPAEEPAAKRSPSPEAL